MMTLHWIPLPIGGVITLTKHDTSGSSSDRQAGALSQPLVRTLAQLLWEQADGDLLLSELAVLILWRMGEECLLNGEDVVLSQIKDAHNLQKQVS